MTKSKLLNQTAICSLVAGLIATPAMAQVDQIVVTATKRSENAQDIPVAVQAIGAEQLDELNVDNFTDYLTQLPGVTNGGSGPGQNTIYIRGVASTTPALSIAGVAGLAPNVALYLDEQPLSQPGRNLDVYAVDLERVEVLPGPQGTLFGASSQAGTIRLITKKPVLGEYQAFANGGISFTKGGEGSYKTEFGANIPVGDRAAIRGVFYLDERGGYIDNVPGTINLRESARFRPAGTIRPNGTAVESFRGGFQSDPASLAAIDSNVTFLDANNANLVENNFNDSSYTGFRVSGRYEVSDDWMVTVGYAQQDIDADGVFFADPELGEYNISRFSPDRIDDDFKNVSWTVEGRLGFLDMVYTGAFTDRDTQQTIDYTEYLLIGQYLPYYLCDSTVTYPSYNGFYGGVAGVPFGTCQPPNLTVGSTSETHVQTHELRFNTPRENRLRATVGAFYSDLRLDERNDFTYPNNVDATVFGSLGFFPNFPQTPGFVSDPGPFPAEVIFRNDIRRTDEQIGFFGEVNFDLVPDLITLTFGTRYYDIEVDFQGSANSSFCNSFQPDADAFGTHISDLYDGDGSFEFIGTCDTSRHITYTLGQSIADIQAIDPALSLAQATQIFNALSAPDKAKTDGFIFKGNVSVTPTDGVLLYATYSEGFRPGLLNRPGGAFQAATGFTVPFEVETDEVKNYELGAKLNIFDNQVQFNGSAFFVDISNLQTTIFDTSIVNLFFSDNAADAEVLGFEGDLIVAPRSISGLTLAGAFSVLDTEITNVITPTGDVTQGAELAFAPTFQGNFRARYEWPVGNDYTAHFMPQIMYSGSSRSDIIDLNAAKVDAYMSMNVSAGVRGEHWSMEIYAENVTDTYGTISTTALNGPFRDTVLRPRTIGVRLGLTY